jgi:hypothetical protein
MSSMDEDSSSYLGMSRDELTQYNAKIFSRPPNPTTKPKKPKLTHEDKQAETKKETTEMTVAFKKEVLPENVINTEIFH